MKPVAFLICLIALILFSLPDSSAQKAGIKADSSKSNVNALAKQVSTIEKSVGSIQKYVDSIKKNIDTFKLIIDRIKPYSDSIENHFKFRALIFSDFAGLDDDQPNGIIQTNVYFSYERPQRQERINKRGYNIFTPVRNFVLMDLTYSKFENDKNKLPVRYIAGQSTGYVNKLDLYQYSHLKVLSKINLLTVKVPTAIPSRPLSIYLDGIVSFYRTTIKDSLKLSRLENLITFAPGGNIKIRTEMDPLTKLNAELSFTYIRPWLYSKAYTDIGGPQYLERPGEITPEIADKKFYGITMTDLLICQNAEKTSKFVRISLCGNYLPGRNETPNIFYQFLVGVDFNLSKIFDKSECSK